MPDHKQTTILLTSINWRASLVKRFRSPVSDGNFRRIITADTDVLAAGTRFSDRHYPVPPYTDRTAYFNRLREIVTDEAPDMVIPNTDRDCIHLNEYRDYLDSKGVRLFMPDVSTVAILNDKLASYRFFSEHGIDTPFTVPAADIPPATTSPLIVKPRTDSGSHNVFRAANSDQAGCLAAMTGDAVIQPFIGGIEYSVDAVVDFDGEVVGVVPRKRLATKAGTAVKTVTCHHTRLCELTREICRLLPLAGISCLQFIEEEITGRIYLLEVNPRIGSGTLVSIRAGFDIPEIVCRLFHGEKITLTDGFFENRLLMLYYHEPLFIPDVSEPFRGRGTSQNAPATQQESVITEHSSHSGRKISTVIFDLDDTLISTREYSLECLRNVASKVHDDHRDIDSKKFFHALRQRYDEGPRETLLGETLKQYSIFSPSYLDQLISVYRSTSIENSTVFSGSREVLSELARIGIRLFLITDGNPESQQCKMNNLGIGRYFEQIIYTGEGDSHLKKPGSAAYASILHKTECTPEQTCAVGDNPYRDFAGCRKLGILTLRIRRADGRFSHLSLDNCYEADYELVTLHDIFNFLGGRDDS